MNRILYYICLLLAHLLDQNSRYCLLKTIVIRFSNFLIICLSNYSANCCFKAISLSIVGIGSLCTCYSTVESICTNKFICQCSSRPFIQKLWTIEEILLRYLSYFTFLAILNTLSRSSLWEAVLVGKLLKSSMRCIMVKLVF